MLESSPRESDTSEAETKEAEGGRLRHAARDGSPVRRLNTKQRPLSLRTPERSPRVEGDLPNQRLHIGLGAGTDVQTGRPRKYKTRNDPRARCATIKAACPPKLKPVTFSVFRSVDKTAAAVVAVDCLVNVESNEEVLNVTSYVIGPTTTPSIPLALVVVPTSVGAASAIPLAASNATAPNQFIDRVISCFIPKSPTWRP